MGRRAFVAVAWGLGGLVVALVLTLGAFAIAGQEISEPAGAPVLTPGASTPPDEAAHPSQDDETTRSATTATETPSPADRGGSEDAGGGSDDSSGPGSGSDDDNSGSGSDDSGSGSDDSGNGSDNSGSSSDNSGSDDSSGSGSGEHEDD